MVGHGRHEVPKKKVYEAHMIETFLHLATCPCCVILSERKDISSGHDACCKSYRALLFGSGRHEPEDTSAIAIRAANPSHERGKQDSESVALSRSPVSGIIHHRV